MSLKERIAKVIKERIFSQLELDASDSQLEAVINEASHALLNEFRAFIRESE